MSITAHASYKPRPRLWRNRHAFEEVEVRPCGSRGGLISRCWHRASDRPAPDLSDCLVTRPKPFRLVIWQPLHTKAPGPHLAQPYCCYINTIIFYHRPYAVSPWKKIYRIGGKLDHAPTPGHFEEWDHIESRLTWDDVVEYEGDLFDVHGGIVIWANAAGEPRRWWMRHGVRPRPAEARR